MLRISLGYIAGVLLMHQLPALPGLIWTGLAVAAAMCAWRCLRSAVLAGFLTGLAWAHGFALLNVPAVLPGDDQRFTATLVGTVTSLVPRNATRARIVFLANEIETGADVRQGEWRVRLSWHNPPKLQPGQRWSLPVRLRHAHGYAAPGAWDYEGWLYWQGIRYTGYVTDAEQAVRLGTKDCCRVARLRQRLAEAVADLPFSAFARGVIQAITVGDRSGLDDSASELLRSTGTSHLMAISGLHISLVAGLGLLLFSAAWRLSATLCSRVPARVAGVVAGLVFAAAYAALAGFGLPTQRALVMLAVFGAALIMRFESGSGNTLALAALAVVSWHPPSVMSAGFWLSFGAVGIILAVLAHAGRRPWWQRVAGLHLAISFALWPVLATFGLPGSLVSPVANLLMVPLFSFLVVPASLLGVGLLETLPDVARALLGIVAVALDRVEAFLAWITVADWPDLASQALTPMLLVLLVGALLLLLSPPGNPLRWLAVPLLLTVLLPRERSLQHGEFRLHVLDVGQGLSNVVETANHVLVFDTGPAYRSGFSTASAVLLPFLREIGRRRIDRLVVSHGDQDHAGGLDQLTASIRIDDIQSGEPDRIGPQSRRCLAGDSWRWDGVAFDVLHPDQKTAYRGNDASCVLRVGNPGGSVLLTGDIEQDVERILVRRIAGELRSDVVLAPHHGSRSSSSRQLVEATVPGFVVYSAGWSNRYGFPAAEVTERWQAVGARALSTAERGTLSFHFPAAGRIGEPQGHRLRYRRFWHHRLQDEP